MTLSDHQLKIFMDGGTYIIDAAGEFAQKNDLAADKELLFLVVEGMRVALSFMSDEIGKAIKEENLAKGGHDQVHANGAKSGLRTATWDFQDGGNQATEGPDRE